MMTTKKNLLAATTGAAMMTALVACSSTNPIEGEWIQPVPGMEQMTQGISLQADGKASSINMATLQYKSWKQEGSLLILTGKSIGNHQTIDFADTLTIERLTADSLVLKRGNLPLKYGRKQP